MKKKKKEEEKVCGRGFAAVTWQPLPGISMSIDLRESLKRHGNMEEVLPV